MADLDTLIPDARRFLAELDANNSRDWFQDNKSTYDAQLKAPAQQLLAEMEPALAEIAGAPVTSKLFRANRDVRFSKDKTPYNTHLHMMWAIQSEAIQNPVFFFGIGLDYVTAGVGMMGFDKPMQGLWRKWVDLDTARILGTLQEVKDKGFSFREPELKRVPPPFDADHLGAELLRRKGLIASTEIAPQSALVDNLTQAFRDGWPLNAVLLQIAES